MALDYAGKVAKFLEHTKIQDIQALTDAKLDASLSIYLNSMFEAGSDVSDGSKTFAAVLDTRLGSSSTLGSAKIQEMLEGLEQHGPGDDETANTIPVDCADRFAPPCSGIRRSLSSGVVNVQCVSPAGQGSEAALKRQ